MDKISSQQASQLTKLAAENLRVLSGDKQRLQGELGQAKEKLAHYEKQDRARRIAEAMDEKGMQPEIPFKDKVAGLMKRDDLDVFEQAVELNAPQIKTASVAGDDRVDTEGGPTNAAEQNFMNAVLEDS